tara:strand:+ start:1151 stop:1360 length:210 start_codon:yes stop_codon:yes gene_type:complete
MIKQITIITAPGPKTYKVGQKLAGGVVSTIKLDTLRFNGDPFSQYCGYSQAGKLLFNVDPMCPHECEYL